MLHARMSEDPSIFKPTGGLHFFSRENADPSLSRYLSQFSAAAPDRTCVDLSVSYSYPAEASAVADQMRVLAPLEPLIFALVRDPVDRCISDYRRSIMLGELDEGVGLMTAIARDPELVTRGHYFSNLQPFADVFGKNRINFFLFEDLVKHPSLFFSGLNRLLGTEIPPTNVQSNASQSYRFSGLPHVLRGARTVVDATPGLPPFVRRRLSNIGGLVRKTLAEPFDEYADVDMRAIAEMCAEDAAMFAEMYPHLGLRARWTSTFRTKRAQ